MCATLFLHGFVFFLNTKKYMIKFQIKDMDQGEESRHRKIATKKEGSHPAVGQYKLSIMMIKVKYNHQILALTFQFMQMNGISY